MTDTFKVYIVDQNDQKLAVAESGVTYQAIAGSISGVKCSATRTEVNSVTDLTISFTLPHRLSAQTSKLTLSFPENLLMTNVLVVPVAPTEYFSSSTFTFTKQSGKNTFELSKLFSQAFPGGLAV